MQHNKDYRELSFEILDMGILRNMYTFIHLKVRTAVTKIIHISRWLQLQVTRLQVIKII